LDVGDFISVIDAVAKAKERHLKKLEIEEAMGASFLFNDRI
tara:strand:+ start:271 stop:393 length:123 start_codon:yes stop_codon:yes gene_type:complete